MKAVAMKRFVAFIIVAIKIDLLLPFKNYQRKKNEILT